MPNFTISHIHDVSTPRAKRYTAWVILSEDLTKDDIRCVIAEATEMMKDSTFYENDRTRERWGDKPAHAVWLYVAASSEDAERANWLCRTQWISPELAEEYRPLPLDGNDKVGDIIVRWERA